MLLHLAACPIRPKSGERDTGMLVGFHGFGQFPGFWLGFPGSGTERNKKHAGDAIGGIKIKPREFC